MPKHNSLASAQQQTLADERFAEIKRGQAIIDGLVAFREFALTKAVSADEINVLLSEHPEPDERPFVAVQIAEAIEKRLREFPVAVPSL
jgi:hypothetical protein